MFGSGSLLVPGPLARACRRGPGRDHSMIATTALGYSLARYPGWSPEAGLILGLAVSVASTVVLLRALMDFGVLDSVHGRVAVAGSVA